MSFFPLRLLYLISDILYYFVFYILKYRRKVVFDNIRNSFPEKDSEEINKIAKSFYRHLVDVVFETIKIFSYNSSKLEKHFSCSNTEVLENLYTKNKSFLLTMGHYGNWEWINSYMSIIIKFDGLAIYKPLENKFFNKLAYKLRSKYGAIPVAMNNVLRELLKYKSQNLPMVMGVITDQCPTYKEINYWTNFLNRETPIYFGSEKLAKKFDLAVVFIHAEKKGRGKYHLDFELITENPAITEHGFITEKHTRLLEKQIIDNPSYWLWSHKRWKRTKEGWLKYKNEVNN